MSGGEITPGEDALGFDRQFAAVTQQLRTRIFDLREERPLAEQHPLEARPLAEGLRAIAADPLPPGPAYAQLMDWARERGYFGYASTYENPGDLLSSWLPTWRNGLYVSTAITSGGAALDPTLSPPEVVARNTAIAEQLTDQIIADHDFDPRDVLLSTDLPYVKGWKQSDYLTFWLLCTDGVPVDVCEEIAGLLGTYADHIGMDRKDLTYDEKWARYAIFVDEFFDLARRYRLHNRNDYYKQVAGIQQLVQLVDPQRSLGCRAEKLYAQRRGMQVLAFELNGEALNPALRRNVGELAAMGANIGRPPARATRLLPA